MADRTDGLYEEEFMLTTVDNPFDPFTQWSEWFAYDVAHGYHSCALLDRVAVSGDELSDAIQSHALQTAIDEIVRENVSGVHRKVSAGMVRSTTEET